MPNSGKEKYYKQIEISSALAAAVAAKRDVNIFFEPGGQGNMPSAPKFLYGKGSIRIIKVFFKVES